MSFHRFIFLTTLLLCVLSISLTSAVMEVVNGTDSTAQTINVTQGDTFSIDIWITGNDTVVNAVGAFLDYSNSYYTLQSVTSDATIFGDTLQNDSSDTYFDYNVMTTSDSTNQADVRLATLVFTSTAVGTSTIDFYSVSDTENRQSAIVDYNYGLNIASSYLGCTIIVDTVVEAVGETGVIVISEIGRDVGGADNSYIELYNPTDFDFCLNGWELQREASTISTTPTASVGFDENDTIPSKGYFLITEALPTNSTLLSDSDKTMALAYTTSSIIFLTNSTANAADSVDPIIVDLVGFGSVDGFEGTVLGTLSAGGSWERKARSTSTEASMATGSDSNQGNGYDSDNNLNDFVSQTTAPSPQGSQSGTEVLDVTAPVDVVGVAVAVGNGTASLSWTANAEADSVYYNVYYSTSVFTTVNNAVLYDSISVDSIAYDFTGLTNDSQYWFAITCVDLYDNEDTQPNVVTDTPAAPVVPAGQDTMVILSAYHTVTMDGTNDFEVDTEIIGSCTQPTDWGAGLNELDTMYLTYTADTVYVGISGRAQTANRIIVYVDRDFNQSTGADDIASDLNDAGDQNRIAVSSTTLDASSISGFGAELALVWHDETGGYAYRFETVAKFTNFDYLSNSVVNEGTDYIEFAIPVSDIYNDTEINGKQLALFVVLTNSAGNSLSNQYIPDSAITVQNLAVIEIDLDGDSVLDDYTTPSGDVTPPLDVAGIAVTVGNGTATLTWTANIETDSAYYSVYYSTSVFTSVDNAILSETISVDSISYDFTGLTNDSQYWFAVTCVDTTGNEDTEPTVVTDTPTEPVVAGETGIIVISEIGRDVGGADNSYIELYNPTDFDFCLNGWELQREASTISTTPTASVGFDENDTIPSKGYFLITEALPTNSTLLSDSDKTMALAYTTSSIIFLTNSTANAADSVDPIIVDLVGFGSVDGFEGTVLGTLSAGGSWERKARSTSTEASMATGSDSNQGNGYDSDNNLNDFVSQTTAPSPQGSQSGTEVLDVTAPVDVTGVAVVAGNATATLSWTANAEADSVYYNVYYSTSVFTTVNNAVLYDSISVDSVSYDFTGLTNDSQYWFAITCVDLYDNEDSQPTVVSDTPAIPVVGSVTISGTVACEAGPDSNIVVWFYESPGNAILDYDTTTASGTFNIQIDSGSTGYLRAKESHHLAVNGATLSNISSDTSIDLGTLTAGDADDNNKINIFDASIVKSKQQATKADIDRSGTPDATDLNYVRTNFSSVGESLK